METSRIENVIKSGISFDDYCILKLADKYNIFDYKDKINQLVSKVADLRIRGYLDGQEIPEITLKAQEVLLKIENSDNSNNIKYDFVTLHKKLQDILFKHTNKKQKLVQGKYQFLPNSTDLKTRLLSCIKKYKLTNFKKIENLLIEHTKKAIKANFEYTKTIEYFISKNNNSDLATAYFSEEEVKEEKKEELTNIKDLF